MTCFIHGQKRRFDIDLVPHGDSLCVEWGIERNLKGWRGSYTMTPEALESAERLSFRMPEDGNRLVLDAETLSVEVCPLGFPYSLFYTHTAPPWRAANARTVH